MVVYVREKSTVNELHLYVKENQSLLISRSFSDIESVLQRKRIHLIILVRFSSEFISCCWFLPACGCVALARLISVLLGCLSLHNGSLPFAGYTQQIMWRSKHVLLLSTLFNHSTSLISLNPPQSVKPSSTGSSPVQWGPTPTSLSPCSVSTQLLSLLSSS